MIAERPILLDPSIIEANIGDTVYFRCLSMTPVLWIMEGGEMGKNTHSFVHKDSIHQLTIENVEESNAGTYECYSEQDNIIYVGVGVLKIKKDDLYTCM